MWYEFRLCEIFRKLGEVTKPNNCRRKSTLVSDSGAVTYLLTNRLGVDKLALVHVGAVWPAPSASGGQSVQMPNSPVVLLICAACVAFASSSSVRKQAPNKNSAERHQHSAALASSFAVNVKNGVQFELDVKN